MHQRHPTRPQAKGKDYQLGFHSEGKAPEPCSSRTSPCLKQWHPNRLEAKGEEHQIGSHGGGTAPLRKGPSARLRSSRKHAPKKQSLRVNLSKHTRVKFATDGQEVKSLFKICVYRGDAARTVEARLPAEYSESRVLYWANTLHEDGVEQRRAMAEATLVYAHVADVWDNLSDSTDSDSDVVMT